MTKVDRWLLPEGIEEILPNQAFDIEQLRRRLLDVYDSWGYDLVIPPMVEFTDSLLSGSGRDLDLLTVKFTDQLSGKTMGVHADVTPQTARMDAHSLRRNGPNRLCYASTVLYSHARNPMSSRSPIQVGVELYGVDSLEADIEVISLLAEALTAVGVCGLGLDLGHVGIYRSIEESLPIDDVLKGELFGLLQAKSCELDAWADTNIEDIGQRAVVKLLPSLSGGEDILDRARELLVDAPAEVELALDELQQVVDSVRTQYPQLGIYLDLCELEGYHYHTGIVFAAYCDGSRQVLGNGGRYDDIGESFGRARAATGFGVDLKAVANLTSTNSNETMGIYAPPAEDRDQLLFIRQLRERGERVVCGFSAEQPDYRELRCDRILVVDNGQYTVKPVNDGSLR